MPFRFDKNRYIQGVKFQFRKYFSDEAKVKEAQDIYSSLFDGFDNKSDDEKKLIADEMNRRLHEMKAVDNQVTKQPRVRETQRGGIVQRTSLRSSSAADQQSDKINEMLITSEDEESDDSSDDGDGPSDEECQQAFLERIDQAYLKEQKTDDEVLLANLKSTATCRKYKADVSNHTVMKIWLKTAAEMREAMSNFILNWQLKW